MSEAGSQVRNKRVPMVDRGNGGMCWKCCGTSPGLARYQEHPLILCDDGIAGITRLELQEGAGNGSIE